MFASTVTEWLSAGGTLVSAMVALAIALWAQEMRGLFHKPKLTASIRMRDPDCHKMTWPDGRDAYFCRLNVDNDGAQAQQVELRLQQLRLRSARGDYQDDPAFRGGLNLVWEYTHEVTLPKIDRHLPKHCDLLWVTKDTPLLFELATSHCPNPVGPGVWPTKKPPGQYELDFVVMASNASPTFQTLHIDFKGWYDDSVEMFSKGLVISLEPPQRREATASSGTR